MSSKRNVLGRGRKALQKENNAVFHFHSCRDKRDYGSYAKAVEHVAGILRGWLWFSRSGSPTNITPHSWNMVPYRCGFGNHVHMGHPYNFRNQVRTKRRLALQESFRDDVLEWIALELWQEVNKELDQQIKIRLSLDKCALSPEGSELITEAS